MNTCQQLMHAYSSYLIISLHLKSTFGKTYLLSAISCIVIPCSTTWVACEYIQSTHWLATGYLIGQAWKSRIMAKSSLMTNMRTRMLPSQNACRFKADGMGSRFRSRFPLLVMFKCLALVALSM